MIMSLGPLPAGDKSVAMYRQITEHLRNLIHRGKLKPGTRLPGMIAMAKLWKTNYFTVRLALTPLANEGLIRRTPRGTFVSDSDTRINSVALYYGANPWDDPEGSYFQQAYREISGELRRRKIHTHLFMDSREPKQQFSPLSQLTRAIERREIQGLIGLMLNSEDIQWLEKLPIPVSLLGAPHPVAEDPTHVLAFDRLAQEGCKTVGMITPASHDVYPEFERMVEARGMKTRESWLKRHTESGPVYGEALGYRAFKELWKQKQRPRGLFIFPDWVCRGAITAILELGVRVPQQLRLVLFRNEGLEFVCPWQVPMVVSDVRQTAVALVDHLLIRKPRKKTSPVVTNPPPRLAD